MDARKQGIRGDHEAVDARPVHVDARLEIPRALPVGGPAVVQGRLDADGRARAQGRHDGAVGSVGPPHAHLGPARGQLRGRAGQVHDERGHDQPRLPLRGQHRQRGGRPRTLRVLRGLIPVVLLRPHRARLG